MGSSTTLLQHGVGGGALQQRPHLGGDMKTQCGAAAAASMSSSLGTLCFDVELDEGCSRQQAGARHKSNVARQTDMLKHFLQPTGAFAVQLLSDVAVIKRSLERERASMDMVELASRLAAVGADVTVRKALGPAGCPGGAACFCHLRHEFITVRAGAGDWEGVECIVEPFFREHFAIPRPTPEYQQLLEVVPDVMVASASQLTLVVQALCAAMAESFAAYGMSLPPWRRAKSMLSKWLPPCARDTAMRRPANGPAAASHGAPQGGMPSSSTSASLWTSSPGAHGAISAAVSGTTSGAGSPAVRNGHAAHHHHHHHHRQQQGAAPFGGAFAASGVNGTPPAHTVSPSEFESALAALAVDAPPPAPASRSSPLQKRLKQSLLTTAMTLAATKSVAAATAAGPASPRCGHHHAGASEAAAAAAVSGNADAGPAAAAAAPLSPPAVVMSLPPVSRGEPTIYKVMHQARDHQQGCCGQNVC